MNKILIILSIFLVVSMGFVIVPNTAYADLQLDILIKIAQNTKEHIKDDIDKTNNISQEVRDFYDSGTKQTSLLIQAVKNEDAISAKQYFIDAMIAFKQASLAISENETQETPQTTISEYASTIKKYEVNIKKLKIISTIRTTSITSKELSLFTSPYK